MNPRHLKAQANLAAALLSAKRYDEAATAFRQAIVVDPKDSDLYAGLGLALEKSGHQAEAKKVYATANALAANGKNSAGHKP
jgi:Flp pilus assembly protein TadD